MTESVAPRYARPRAISPDDTLDRFDCGKPALDDFLRRRALRNEGKASRTYVVTLAGVIVAYYTMSAGAVRLAEAPRPLTRNMPDPLPVVVLGRMAVDRGHAGRGLGQAMLREALQRALDASRSVGVRALLVHAIDDEAVGFYLRYGFVRFLSEGLTLFLPVETIAGAV